MLIPWFIHRDPDDDGDDEAGLGTFLLGVVLGLVWIGSAMGAAQLIVWWWG